MKKPNKYSNLLYRALALEMGKMTQGELSKKVERDNCGLWRSIKEGSTKVNIVVELCDELNLELIIRNPNNGNTHLISKLK